MQSSESHLDYEKSHLDYEKSHLDYETQARQLQEKNIAGSLDIIREKLQSVTYRRLSQYADAFRAKNSNGISSNSCRPGTTIVHVWGIYRFDRRLKIVVLDALERVEICLKARMNYHLGQKYGPCGYGDPQNLAGGQDKKRDQLYKKILEESRRPYNKHFMEYCEQKSKNKYPPIGVAVEIMSFGLVNKLFSAMKERDQTVIAHEFGIPRPIFASWLLSLNTIRNICAHHDRLWNYTLRIKPKIPTGDKYPQWHKPIATPNDRMFSILSILRFLVKEIAPGSKWSDRLDNLFSEFSFDHRDQMGFPEGWEDHSLWQ